MATEEPVTSGTDRLPGEWTNTGNMTEVLSYYVYLVKMNRSRRVTQRRRKFLRKIVLFSWGFEDKLEPSTQAGPSFHLTPPTQVRME